jgi:hypothetical protein
VSRKLSDFAETGGDGRSWVVECDVDVEVADIAAPVAFRHAHGLTPRVPDAIEPDPVVQPNRFDNETSMRSMVLIYPLEVGTAVARFTPPGA